MVKILIPTTKERRPILHRCMESCGDNAGMPHQIIVYENNEGYVMALKEMIYSCYDEDIVVLINDDIVFGKDWLRILFDAFSGVGIAQPQEMNNPVKEDKAVTPIGLAGWFKEYAHFGYKHNYIDQEWTDVAKQRGTFLFVPDSHIYHNHWSFGKSERDSTYLEQMKDFEFDKDLYQERFALSSGFKDLDAIS